MSRLCEFMEADDTAYSEYVAEVIGAAEKNHGFTIAGLDPRKELEMLGLIGDMYDLDSRPENVAEMVWKRFG